MQVRKMRLLRHKHQITRPELGRACALSPQRISEIELSYQRINEDLYSIMCESEVGSEA